MKRASISILLPLLLAAQAPQQPVPQDPDKARVEGHVFNSVTGEALRKTKLTLRMNVAQERTTRQQSAEKPVTLYTVTTDSEGKYTFANVDPGDYQLTVTREGFADLKLGNTGGVKKIDPI